MPPSNAASRSNVPSQGLLQALADNIRRERKALGLTQEALGRKAGLERSYVSHLEGLRIPNPTLGSIATLAGALGTTVSQLLRESSVTRKSKPAP